MIDISELGKVKQWSRNLVNDDPNVVLRKI